MVSNFPMNRMASTPGMLEPMVGLLSGQKLDL